MVYILYALDVVFAACASGCNSGCLLCHPFPSFDVRKLFLLKVCAVTHIEDMVQPTSFLRSYQVLVVYPDYRDSGIALLSETWRSHVHARKPTLGPLCQPCTCKEWRQACPSCSRYRHPHEQRRRHRQPPQQLRLRTQSRWQTAARLRAYTGKELRGEPEIQVPEAVRSVRANLHAAPTWQTSHSARRPAHDHRVSPHDRRTYFRRLLIRRCAKAVTRPHRRPTPRMRGPGRSPAALHAPRCDLHRRPPGAPCTRRSRRTNCRG